MRTRERDTALPALIGAIHEGACLFEKAPDRPDGLRDYRYVAMNAAMQEIFGVEDLTGQSFRDNFPDESEAWYDDYDSVMESGRSMRIERSTVFGDKLIEMLVGRIELDGQKLLLAVIEDVTRRKNAEDALRISEERSEFLLKLTDAIRPHDDPSQIVSIACELLAERLDVDRAYYVEIDEAAGFSTVTDEAVRNGVQPLAGRHAISAYNWPLDTLKRGESETVSDVRKADVGPDTIIDAFLALDIVSSITTPLVKDGKLIGVLCVTSSRPREWRDCQVAVLREVSERIWAAIERSRAERAARETEARYRQLFENIGEGYLLVEPIRADDGALVDVEILEANPAAERLIGRELAGERLGDTSERLKSAAARSLDRALKTGKPHNEEFWEEALEKHLDIGVTDVGDGMAAILLRDMTSVERHAREQKLLVSELNHRVRNMLAVVSSIARQTMRNSTDMAGFTEAFAGRMSSLARAHAILVQSRWEGADLVDLVTEELSHFHEDTERRLSISGPHVMLESNVALSLSLALHELATNAIRFGAWSNTSGKIDVRWTVDEDGNLTFDWTETGGPKVSPPEHAGFGTMLLTKGIARELSGDVVVRFPEKGLTCRVEFNPGNGFGERAHGNYRG